jgi:uncharacterized membrane protein YgcG
LWTDFHGRVACQPEPNASLAQPRLTAGWRDRGWLNFYVQKEIDMTRFRHIAPVVAAAALIGLAGCSNSNQQATAAPPAAPPPAPAPPPPPTPTVNPMAPSTLRQVQTALKQDGLYRGRVDGKWGPHTEHAVMAYQQKNGLQASGQLDQPTLASLNIGGGGSSSMSGGTMGGGNMSGGSMGGGAPMGGSSAPPAPGSSGTTNP